MHPGEVALLGSIVLLLLPPWLAARDVRRQPRPAMQAAGVSRTGSLLLVVLVPVLGPALWLRWLRPRVRTATARTR